MTRAPSGKRIAIVGGGWSGLAAAVTLAGAGRLVTVFEAAAVLGGRARRVDLDGVAVDNGQHILLGAYRRALALLDAVHGAGSESALLERRRLLIEEPGGFRLRLPALPAPWHALAGLLAMRGVSWSERLATVAFARRLRAARFRCAPPLTVTALLAGQPANVVRQLWEPLCVAALDTPAARASAQVFLNLIGAAFSARARDSDLLLPRVDLSALFPDAAARFLLARGGEIRLRQSVTEVSASEEAVALSANGASDAHAACIIAVGPHQLDPLVAKIATPEAAAARAQVAAFAYQPIRTIYLRYPLALPVAQPMLKLDGDPGQWLFDRGRLGGERGLAAVVISTDTVGPGVGHDDLVRAIDAQLRRLLPGLPAPVWSQVIAERRAAYACEPALERPAPGPLAPRLYLAGDYCDPGFPATLEAASRSGVAAARRLLADGR